MKKVLLALLLSVFLVGCAKKNHDPYASYRKLSEKALFSKAESELAHHKYNKASRSLEAMDAIYPFGPYTQRAQLDIIYAYYKSGDRASALAAAERYVRLYPRDRYVDYAYYMKGRISYELNGTWLQRLIKTDPAPHDPTSLRDSFFAFSQLVHYFPHSAYRPSAIYYMTLIRDTLARREMQIATYYFKKEAYVAAANRASYVVEHYQGAPETIDALAMMVKSYRALGMAHLADHALSLLESNYPKSHQYKELR